MRDWEEQRRAADLAEKRRVAPGWLDNDVHLIKPENTTTDSQVGVEEGSGAGRQDGTTEMGMGMGMGERRHSVGIKGLVEARDGVPDPKEGEELDRVCGGLDLK